MRALQYCSRSSWRHTPGTCWQHDSRRWCVKASASWTRARWWGSIQGVCGSRRAGVLTPMVPHHCASYSGRCSHRCSHTCDVHLRSDLLRVGCRWPASLEGPAPAGLRHVGLRLGPQAQQRRCELLQARHRHALRRYAADAGHVDVGERLEGHRDVLRLAEVQLLQQAGSRRGRS